MKHLHKDIRAVGYWSGVWAALRDTKQLINDFASLYRDRNISFGLHDPPDPHVVDIAVDGNTVGFVERHHDRGDVWVYTDHKTHEPLPEGATLVETARKRGYETI